MGVQDGPEYAEILVQLVVVAVKAQEKAKTCSPEPGCKVFFDPTVVRVVVRTWTGWWRRHTLDCGFAATERIVYPGEEVCFVHGSDLTASSPRVANPLNY
jgi:hypothetical protein